jgi:hypothetical protein
MDLEAPFPARQEFTVPVCVVHARERQSRREEDGRKSSNTTANSREPIFKNTVVLYR